MKRSTQMQAHSLWRGRRGRRVRAMVLARDGGVCRYCGAPATEVDHVVPRKVDPTRTLDPSNLVACCRKCNLAKGSAFHVEIAPVTPAQSSLSPLHTRGGVFRAPQSPDKGERSQPDGK